MIEWILNSVALLFFAIALLFYKLNTRLVNYNKVAIVCLAFCLLPIAYFISIWLAYALQFILLVGLARVSHRYYKEGLFRRRKELHEIFSSRHPDHVRARKEIYPHLKHLGERERELDSEKKSIDRMKSELREEAEKIRAEKEEIERRRKALKEAHFDMMAERERR